ncbi:hypothetical protein ACQUY5_25740 [Bacillus cereus]|uniref:hypothetical protein n=1 Tax=Bacillus cereus TaxID=1396 RepID=UPI003D1799B0
MILLNNLEFTREEQDSAYKKLEVRGLQSAEDNMTMLLEEDTIVIAPNEDVNAQTQYMYIGHEIGILKGTVVKAQVIFLDGAMFVNVVSGVVDTKTRMFSETGDMEAWLLESNLDSNDVAVLEASENEDYPTRWVTHKELFDLMNASIKNEYFTYETLFELNIAYNKHGMFSCVPTGKVDMSNGKMEEKKAELQREEDLRKQQAEQRKLDRQLEHERREKEREEREHEALMAKNKDVKAMFDKILNR